MKTSYKMVLGLAGLAGLGVGFEKIYKQEETKRQRVLLRYVQNYFGYEDVRTSWMMEEPIHGNSFQGGLIVYDQGRLINIDFEIDDDTQIITEIERREL